MDRKVVKLLKTEIFEILREIKLEIEEKMSSFLHKPLNSHRKNDGTLVTQMDLFISDIFENKFNSKFPKINFYSEEKQKEFKFPLIILDPIDGTREFAKGMDECAVSFGIYYSEAFDDPRNFSWIYNFKTGLEVSSEASKLSTVKRDDLLGFVSNTEFEKGLYPEGNIRPVGSIAYKLALLINGDCDFVITKKPKNIWDIAAGTHLCKKFGFEVNFLEGDSTKITSDLYQAPMIWCRKNNMNQLIDQFKIEKK